MMQKLYELLLARKHPFDFDRRERIIDELDDAESRFRKMQQSGNPHAAELAVTTLRAKHAIMSLWEDVRDVERAEEENAEGSSAPL
jgi:hypothetical protein